MIASSLIEEIKEHIREQRLFMSVDDYAGEFASDDIEAKSFTSPAALVSCLGWQKIDRGEYIAGRNTWRVRIAIFVVTKNPKRERRFSDAMHRAERLTAVFRGWYAKVHSGQPVGITAENLHSRPIDKKGLALWMVSWWQEVEFSKMPCGTIPSLPDFKNAEFVTKAQTSVDEADPALPNLNVSQTLEMNNGKN